MRVRRDRSGCAKTRLRKEPKLLKKIAYERRRPRVLHAECMECMDGNRTAKTKASTTTHPAPRNTH